MIGMLNTCFLHHILFNTLYEIYIIYILDLLKYAFGYGSGASKDMKSLETAVSLNYHQVILI